MLQVFIHMSWRGNENKNIINHWTKYQGPGSEAAQIKNSNNLNQPALTVRHSAKALATCFRIVLQICKTA